MVIKEASDAMSELASQMTTEFTEISKHSLKKGKIEKSKGALLGHHWKRLPWIAYFIALDLIPVPLTVIFGQMINSFTPRPSYDRMICNSNLKISGWIPMTLPFNWNSGTCIYLLIAYNIPLPHSCKQRHQVKSDSGAQNTVICMKLSTRVSASFLCVCSLEESAGKVCIVEIWIWS